MWGLYRSAGWAKVMSTCQTLRQGSSSADSVPGDNLSAPGPPLGGRLFPVVFLAATASHPSFVPFVILPEGWAKKEAKILIRSYRSWGTILRDMKLI